MLFTQEQKLSKNRDLTGIIYFDNTVYALRKIAWEDEKLKGTKLTYGKLRTNTSDGPDYFESQLQMDVAQNGGGS